MMLLMMVSFISVMRFLWVSCVSSEWVVGNVVVSDMSLYIV